MALLRKCMAFTSFLVTIGILGGAFAFFYGARTYVAAGPLTASKEIVIEKGQGVNAIATTLEREGVIAHALAFRIAARATAQGRTLKAGEYEFPAQISLEGALRKLMTGDVMARSVTIPEGLTSWQIVQILNGVEKLGGTVDAIPAEGALLPETYRYESGQTRAQKISEMQTAMTAMLDSLWDGRAPNLPFDTKEQAVTLASIVEKETGVAAERSRIAGVFVNRLRAGMPLQSDPTAIYALTKGEIKSDGQGPLGRRLLTKDLEIDSPYNTYKYRGLPPGPIANPGRDALAATLNPETHDYIYFVADGAGGHAFARTLEEHNANVARWRAVRAN